MAARMQLEQMRSPGGGRPALPAGPGGRGGLGPLGGPLSEGSTGQYLKIRASRSGSSFGPSQPRPLTANRPHRTPHRRAAVRPIRGQAPPRIASRPSNPSRYAATPCPRCSGHLIRAGMCPRVSVRDRHGPPRPSEHGDVVGHVTEGQHLGRIHPQLVGEPGQAGRLGHTGRGNLDHAGGGGVRGLGHPTEALPDHRRGGSAAATPGPPILDDPTPVIRRTRAASRPARRRLRRGDRADFPYLGVPRMHRIVGLVPHVPSAGRRLGALSTANLAPSGASPYTRVPPHAGVPGTAATTDHLVTNGVVHGGAVGADRERPVGRLVIHPKQPRIGRAVTKATAYLARRCARAGRRFGG